MIVRLRWSKMSQHHFPPLAFLRNQSNQSVVYSKAPKMSLVILNRMKINLKVFLEIPISIYFRIVCHKSRPESGAVSHQNSKSVHSSGAELFPVLAIPVAHVAFLKNILVNKGSQYLGDLLTYDKEENGLCAHKSRSWVQSKMAPACG